MLLYLSQHQVYTYLILGQNQGWAQYRDQANMKVVKTGTQLVCESVHTSTALNQTPLKDNNWCVCKEGTELGTFEIRTCAQFQE
jgi:hypothetical protein